MTEINRPKLNLSALKWNKQSTPRAPENQEKKASINTNTSNLSMPKTTQATSQIQKANINNISANKTNPEPKVSEKIKNKELLNNNIVEKNKNQIETKNLESHKNANNPIKSSLQEKSSEKKDDEVNLTKSSLQETILKKEEQITKTEEKSIEETTKETIEENNKKINENWEIFSGYTSDFANKKEEALKESKKVKLPDSPKKIFFAIFTSLLILSSLALVIIFKVDKPTTNKIKANILDLIWKAEKKPAQAVETKTKESWEKSIYNSIWFSINYEKSNTGKYKIDWKILNNKNEFNNYIKNKIEKLKLEKLKKHLQEEKVAN